MTYNERLLFTTTDVFLSDLSNDLGYVYDWNAIQGADMFSGSFWAWDLGRNVEIASPSAYYGDELFIEVGNGKMTALNEFSVSQGYADFGLVVFGDNDEWASTSGDGIDWHHSGLSFDVEVSLVEN